MKKNRLLKISIAAGLVTIVLVISLLDKVYTVPVLMYHSINLSSDNSRLIVSERSFGRQMKYLKDKRYNIISLDEYADMLRTGKKPKKKTVVITFDDGFKDNYTKAYPVLSRLNIPATVFVVTDWVGREDMLDWEQVRKMSDDPLIDIGSHSLTHDMLTRIPKEEAMRQIRESKQILENRLEKYVDLFAYPTGDHSEFIKDLTRMSGYKGACATSVDKRTALDDLYAIRRIRVSKSADNLFIFGVQVSGYYTFFKDRRIKKGKWKEY